MKNELIYELNKSFQNIFNDKEALSSFENYYKALVSWLKHNMHLLQGKVEQDKRLVVLLELDPYEYVVKNPGLVLSWEKERVGSRTFEAIDNMLMSIGDTLWDMVTIYSEKSCPRCDDGLRYVIAEDERIIYKELTLECDTCGWAEHLDGREWEFGVVEKIIPANKKDIAELS